MPKKQRIYKTKFINKKYQCRKETDHIAFKHFKTKKGFSFPRKSKISQLSSRLLSHLQFTNNYFIQKQYVLKILLKKATKKLRIYQELCNHYFYFNQKTKVLDISQHFLKQFTTPFYQLAIYQNMALASKELMRYEQAIVYLKKAQQITFDSFRFNQLNSLVCYQIGQICKDINRIPQAVYYYKKCLERYPQFAKAKRGIREIFHEEQSQPDLIYVKNMASYYQNIAYEYQQKKDYPSAIICCLNVISINPFQECAYFMLASAYYFQMDYCRSHYYCEKIIEANPFSAETLNMLGLIESQLGQSDCAAYYFIQSIRTNPNLIEPFYNLSLIYHKQKEKRQSIIQFILSLQKQYNYKAAEQNFAIALKLMGFPDNYYSYFSYITQPIQKDIFPQNSFLLTAMQTFQTIQEINSQLFTEQLTLDRGVLYKLTNSQRANVCYLNAMYPDYTQEKRNNQSYKFIKLYNKRISKISDDHYRVLVCYFIISQMFKEDDYQAVKSMSWLYSNQPSAQCLPVFNQLIYGYQNINAEKVSLACQFANNLLIKQNFMSMEMVLNNQKDHFQLKLNDSLLKCKKHSKKYINFMLNLKDDKICFQLNKLINFSTFQGIEIRKEQTTANIYSQIFSESDHSQFIKEFRGLHFKVKKN